LACGDQRRLTGNGSALEVVLTTMRYTNPRLYFLLKLMFSCSQTSALDFT